MPTVALALVTAWSPPPARADGDPASDVLVSQAVFLPQDAGVSAKQQAQLGALLGAAARSGYQLRVALIGSAADLGSITALWRQPQSYAQFLGQELPLAYKGPLLVLMPNGLGLYRLGGTPPAERSALAGIRAPAAGTGLAATAVTAIQRLAAASGHAVTVPTTTMSPSSGAGSTGPVSWTALAAGGVLIALAWSASLRARPLRRMRRGREEISSN